MGISPGDIPESAYSGVKKVVAGRRAGGDQKAWPHDALRVVTTPSREIRKTRTRPVSCLSESLPRGGMPLPDVCLVFTLT